MKITRTSVFTGIERTMEFDITPEQMENYNSGALIQNAFPHLSEDDREFILSGITPEEWDAAFEENEY